MCLRFTTDEELTMKEVGVALGIGESRVSQIHSLAMVRLRARLNFLNAATPPAARGKAAGSLKKFPVETRLASSSTTTEACMEKVVSQQPDDTVRATPAASATADSTRPAVRPWDIRPGPGQIGAEQLRTINQLHQLFARNLSTAIGGYLRIAFECSLASAEHLTYREFLQRLPEKAYVASIDLAPVDVVAVLQLDLPIAFPIIDVMLGGEGEGSEIARNITEIEDTCLKGSLDHLPRTASQLAGDFT